MLRFLKPGLASPVEHWSSVEPAGTLTVSNQNLSFSARTKDCHHVG
jgi:hypothetical protein